MCDYAALNAALHKNEKKKRTFQMWPIAIGAILYTFCHYLIKGGNWYSSEFAMQLRKGARKELCLICKTHVTKQHYIHRRTFSRDADTETFLQSTELTTVPTERSYVTFLLICTSVIHSLLNAAAEKHLKPQRTSAMDWIHHGVSDPKTNGAHFIFDSGRSKKI